MHPESCTLTPFKNLLRRSSYASTRTSPDATRLVDQHLGGGMIFLGNHLLKHWSTTQTTIALSSGEAELTGLVKGAAHGLGFQALCRDLGFNFGLELKSDATAAIGIARRRGLGRVRHISVADLWIQERLKTGDFKLSKILGAHNPADLLTKFVDKPTLERLIPMAHLNWATGRPEKAPQLTHALVPRFHLGHGLYQLDMLPL